MVNDRREIDERVLRSIPIPQFYATTVEKIRQFATVYRSYSAAPCLIVTASIYGV